MAVLPSLLSGLIILGAMSFNVLGVFARLDRAIQ